MLWRQRQPSETQHQDATAPSQANPILSAADIKKIKGKKQSQADMRGANKLSGFNSISARFV